MSEVDAPDFDKAWTGFLVWAVTKKLCRARTFGFESLC